MMTFSEVVDRFPGPRRPNGQDGFKVICPVHNDTDPSLSVSPGNGAGMLFKCFGQDCKVEDILKAVGLDWQDVLPATDPTLRRKTNLSRITGALSGRPHYMKEGALKNTATRRIVATYNYVDESGKQLYQTVRYEPKTFSQRRPDPTAPGGWTWNLDGVRRVLYWLPQVVKAIAAGETIYIVEGERDVNSLQKIGLTATCNVGGAGKWKAEYSDALRGANVVIINDNDKPGRDHAEQVRRALQGVAADVKVVELPGLPEKGDVTDWIAAGGTREQLAAVAGQRWPAAVSNPSQVSDELSKKELQNSNALSTSSQVRDDVEGKVASQVSDATMQDEGVALYTQIASDITPRPISWLWRDRLPLGKLVSIAGDPGLGKSRVTLSFTATVSRGGKWPAGGGRCEPGEVLIASFEDDLADTVLPRLLAEGADLTKIRFLQGVPGEHGRRAFDINVDTDRLDLHLEHHPNTKLVIVDPISAAMAGIDTHKNAEVRAALHPLAEVAQRRGVCILTVTHLNKGSGSALHRVTGSIAFTAAARVAYIIGKDDADDTGERRLMLPIKNNLGQDRTGVSYTTVQVRLPNGIDTVRIAWGAELVTTSADKAITRDDERGAGQDAEAFLLDLLAAGPVEAEQVQLAARKACIAPITLRRAKAELKITSSKTAFKTGWCWALPAGKTAGNWGTL